MRDLSVNPCNIDATNAQEEPPWLHVRREPFEHGLLPVSSLMHHDGVNSLRTLRNKLLDESHASIESVSISGEHRKRRVDVASIASCLSLPEAHAQLVLDTLASVLSDEAENVDSTVQTPAMDIDGVGADVDDLLIFLYIQTYRRVPPRPYKDAAAVADVWPSTSPFDGFLPSLSPLQQVRPSRRSVPCQAEEEAHQFLFVQKHLPQLLLLMAESTEAGEEDEKVITLEKFDHLGFILRPVDVNGHAVAMSQAAPFFANSDPDMPAAAVGLSQALEWVSQHMCARTEHSREKNNIKENGPGPTDNYYPEGDVTMVDAQQACALPNGIARCKEWYPERLTFVDGVTKASAIRGESDVNGDTVKVSNCHDAVVYVLAPMKYASVFGCSDSIVVLGAVGKSVRVEHCERVQLMVPCARISILNCRECVFFLGVNQRPLILGNNHSLQVAPYNTYYPKLEAHLAQVGIDPTVNRWDKILTLGAVDPHDSLPHPAGIADAQAESATPVQPDRFTTFMVPRLNDGESEQLMTRANPFLLPKVYLLAQQQRNKSIENLRQMLKNIPLEDSRKRELSHAIHAHFKEWLYASGNIRQLYDLQSPEKDVKAMMD